MLASGAPGGLRELGRHAKSPHPLRRAACGAAGAAVLRLLDQLVCDSAQRVTWETASSYGLQLLLSITHTHGYIYIYIYTCTHTYIIHVCILYIYVSPCVCVWVCRYGMNHSELAIWCWANYFASIIFAHRDTTHHLPLRSPPFQQYTPLRRFGFSSARSKSNFISDCQTNMTT